MAQSQYQRLMAACRESPAFHPRVSDIYNRFGFPIKIRSMFSNWIEAQDWSERLCCLFFVICFIFLLFLVATTIAKSLLLGISLSWGNLTWSNSGKIG